MSAPTPHLSDYLRAESEKASPHRSTDGCAPGGCMMPFGMLGMIGGLVGESVPIVGIGLAVFVLGIVALAYGSVKAKQSPEAKEAETDDDMLDEFLWLYDQKAIAGRVHPSALPLLEACAEARSQAVKSLDSVAWMERSKDANWGEIRTSALKAADGAMMDALRTSREVVRTKGMKQTAYEARCADPSFGLQTLERLELIRTEMEELAAHVADEVYTHRLEKSEIRGVLEALQEVHKATAELDGDSPREMVGE